MSRFDPYYKWLGIPPAEQPPDHYRLLGITRFETDSDVISSAADRQMSFVRQQGSGTHSGHAQKLLNELAAARLCLLSDDKRTKYEAHLRSAESASAPIALEDPPDEPLLQVRISRTSVKSLAGAGWQNRLPLIIGMSGAVVASLIVLIYAATRPSTRSSTAPNVQPASSNSGKAGAGEEPARPGPAAPAADPTRVASADPSAMVAEVDLLSNLDPQREAVRGTWELRFGELRAVTGKPADLLEFPNPVPDEYQLEFDAKTTAPATSVNVGLRVGKCVVNVSLDGWGGRTTGMAMVDGLFGDANETTWRGGPLFVPDRWSHVVCRVRRESVLVQCDGRTIIDWKGPSSRLATSGLLRPASEEHLYLASWEHPIAFRQVKLRPLTPAESAAPLPSRETAETKAASPAPPPAVAGQIDYDFERRFAQRMLDRGAKMTLRGEMGNVQAEFAQLPEWRFTVDSVDLKAPKCLAEDTDIADAGRLQRVWGVTIDSDRISDRGFSQFATCEKLISLTLGPHSRISPAAVRSCRRLLTLKLDAPPNAAALLAAAADLPQLGSFHLVLPERTVADLSVLRQLPRLQQLLIENSALTRDNLSGISQCSRLMHLRLIRVSSDISGRQPVDSIPSLRTLAFHAMPVSPEMLALLLDAAPQLESLEFHECNVDSDAWKRLQSTQIRRLTVVQTNFDDGHLPFLPATLENLHLTRTAVTGSGFQGHASGLPKLQSININLMPLTDAGMEQLLARAPNLKNVFLAGTNLTPDAFRRMAELQSLQSVSLHLDQNADACLLNLRTAPALKLIGGKFSDEAKAEFLKARPDCKF